MDQISNTIRALTSVWERFQHTEVNRDWASFSSVVQKCLENDVVTGEPNLRLMELVEVLYLSHHQRLSSEGDSIKEEEFLVCIGSAKPQRLTKSRLSKWMKSKRRRDFDIFMIDGDRDIILGRKRVLTFRNPQTITYRTMRVLLQNMGKQITYEHVENLIGSPYKKERLQGSRLRSRVGDIVQKLEKKLGEPPVNIGGYWWKVKDCTIEMNIKLRTCLITSVKEPTHSMTLKSVVSSDESMLPTVTE